MSVPSTLIAPEPAVQVSSLEKAGTGRLLSLDVFRGATIASMMLVNNAGNWNAVYPPLRHSAWHGWTFTDTIFPFFLWIAGVSMTFSFAKRLERHRFVWPPLVEGGVVLTPAQFALLIEAMDCRRTIAPEAPRLPVQM